MSDLHKFLQDWLDAATGKVAKPAWYNTRWGLCTCARLWDIKQSRPGADAELQHRLKEEFGETFNYYPFGGVDRFYRDGTDGTMHLNKERLAWVRKVLGLTPPAEDTVATEVTGDAYGALRGILDEAYNQSAKGKGLERHGNGKAWTEQPILAITRDTGIGFPTGQAIKKVTEAVGMLGRGEGDAAARELLGAIVYTAAAIHFIREGRE
jgi:hypothetical protein